MCVCVWCDYLKLFCDLSGPLNICLCETHLISRCHLIISQLGDGCVASYLEKGLHVCACDSASEVEFRCV